MGVSTVDKSWIDKCWDSTTKNEFFVSRVRFMVFSLTQHACGH
jgi:hypothetical protein